MEEACCSDHGGVLLEFPAHRLSHRSVGSGRRSQRSLYSTSTGSEAETEGGWSDVYKEDSDSSLEDFDRRSLQSGTQSKHSNSSLGSYQRQKKKSINIPEHVQSFHDEDKDGNDSEEDDMWNSSGDWDGNDTEELVMEHVNNTLVLDHAENTNKLLQHTIQEEEKKQETFPVKETHKDTSLQIQRQDNTDKSTPLHPLASISTPADGRHDLSIPLGLMDPLDMSQEIVFADDSEKDVYIDIDNSNNNDRYNNQGEEESEQGVDWEVSDPSLDAMQDGDDNSQSDQPLGNEEGEIELEQQAKDQPDQSTENDPPPNEHEEQTPPPGALVIDVSADEQKQKQPWEEEKEEIQPPFRQQSDSSFSAVFEPVGDGLALAGAPNQGRNSIAHAIIPEEGEEEMQQEHSVPPQQQSRAPSRRRPSFPVNSTRKSITKPTPKPKHNTKSKRTNYHPNKNRPRSSRDWESLVAKWETMEKDTKQQERQRRRQASAANYVQSTQTSHPIGDNNATANGRPGTPTGSNPPSEDPPPPCLPVPAEDKKSASRGRGKCFGRGVFPFFRMGKSKIKDKEDRPSR